MRRTYDGVYLEPMLRCLDDGFVENAATWLWWGLVEDGIGDLWDMPVPVSMRAEEDDKGRRIVTYEPMQE